MADAQNSSLDSPGSVGAVAVPVVFALIFLLGTVGNGLVLAVLLQPGPSAWQEPGSTTDLFILNLAVADLCFILCCVPFQAAIYTLDAWLFGALVCKAVHLLIYLTMYASSFTLAAVSVDRCAWNRAGAGRGREDLNRCSLALGEREWGTQKGHGERKGTAPWPPPSSLWAPAGRA
ncbi:PREDICTED: galanin receptor type 3 [Myotis brandtii]|uniref:galanin receptor type 3 n=1 Tax=Myotis brandtii TaxID=109478 RepID=UPI0007045253|nr:PREDICTED: galanin receptor type 3 [Myotis brandtii]